MREKESPGGPRFWGRWEVRLGRILRGLGFLEFPKGYMEMWGNPGEFLWGISDILGEGKGFWEGQGRAGRSYSSWRFWGEQHPLFFLSPHIQSRFGREPTS